MRVIVLTIGQLWIWFQLFVVVNGIGLEKVRLAVASHKRLGHIGSRLLKLAINQKRKLNIMALEPATNASFPKSFEKNVNFITVKSRKVRFTQSQLDKDLWIMKTSRRKKVNIKEEDDDEDQPFSIFLMCICMILVGTLAYNGYYRILFWNALINITYMIISMYMSYRRFVAEEEERKRKKTTKSRKVKNNKN